jgi:glycosyltransferase involved in cell wall biosynthesis
VVTISISVVIPAYNGSAYLSDAVESVWCQTRPPNEIIVVDDFSTDGTAALAESLAVRSPVPMRVIRLLKNSGGPAQPINVGIRAATGDFIVVLDQDDAFNPNRLESHLSPLAADPTLAFVVSCCGRWEDNRRLLPDKHIHEFAQVGRQEGDGIRLGGTELLRVLLLQNNIFIGYPAFTFRRDLVVRRGGVDSSLGIASDYDLLCWLCLHGDAVFLAHAHYRRRLHDRNLTRNRYGNIVETFRVRTRYVRKCPALRAAGADRAALQNEYLAVAYAMRRCGCYATSAAISLMTFRAWGMTRPVASELLKVIPHMVVSCLTGLHRDQPFWKEVAVPPSEPCRPAPDVAFAEKSRH